MNREKRQGLMSEHWLLSIERNHDFTLQEKKRDEGKGYQMIRGLFEGKQSKVVARIYLRESKPKLRGFA